MEILVHSVLLQKRCEFMWSWPSSGQHLSPTIILSVALVELQVLKELVCEVVQDEE